jgi:anti-sigma B factor antagonist
MEPYLPRRACDPEVHVAELRLSSECRGDSLIVAIGGELDIVTSRQLDEHLTGARRKYRHIVLDLSAVEFMDTSSLAVIVGHWKRLEAAGGTLVMAGARYRYTKTLWITGLADRLTMYDSVDEAVAAEQSAESHAGNEKRPDPGTLEGPAPSASAGRLLRTGDGHDQPRPRP